MSRLRARFALYVTGYSTFRIFEESLPVDYSQYFLGLHLNFFITSAMTLGGVGVVFHPQRGKDSTATVPQIQRADHRSP